jgi:hypothetical protein
MIGLLDRLLFYYTTIVLDLTYSPSYNVLDNFFCFILLKELEKASLDHSSKDDVPINV